MLINLECTLGQHEYNCDIVRAGLLTLKQYGEYYDIIPQIKDSVWHLATPLKTPKFLPPSASANINHVWCVFAHGSGYGGHCSNGSGCGNGSGRGINGNCCRGFGDGYGLGRGSSCNYNCNEDIKSFNGNPVYYIDGISTIIIKVRKNVAKEFILNDDLTTTPCYVVKHNNTFTHGATLSEAREALRDKLFEDMDEEERIDAFLDEFNLSDKYPTMDFFNWHNQLTGSCKQGRETFVKNHEIDLENDSFTVREFCELCINDYGAEIIKKILERISE